MTIAMIVASPINSCKPLNKIVIIIFIFTVDKRYKWLRGQQNAAHRETIAVAPVDADGSQIENRSRTAADVQRHPGVTESVTELPDGIVYLAELIAETVLRSTNTLCNCIS